MQKFGSMLSEEECSREIFCKRKFDVHLEKKSRKSSIPGGFRCQVEYSALGVIPAKPEILK